MRAQRRQLVEWDGHSNRWRNSRMKVKELTHKERICPLISVGGTKGQIACLWGRSH